MRWLRRPLARREHRIIELRPDEQVALAHLLRFGEAAASELLQVIEVQRAIPREMAEETLADLLSKGMMEEATPTGSEELALAERSYRPAPTAERLRGLLPEKPRSTIEYRLRWRP